MRILVANNLWPMWTVMFLHLVQIQRPWWQGKRSITRNALASKNKWAIFPDNCNIIAKTRHQLTIDVMCLQSEMTTWWPGYADLDHLSNVWVSPEGLTTTTWCTICKLAVQAKTSPRASGHVFTSRPSFCVWVLALFIHHNCEMFISMCKLEQKIFVLC